jgi:2-hydroxychromene-2-carboxylate isomerase
MDLIIELGELALASRLKRLSERLMRDVSRVYRELDEPFEARWFPLLRALLEESPQGVTQVARALGLTHPAVNQLAGDDPAAVQLPASPNRRT